MTYVSLPFFNDVHHVRPTPEGNLLVANTGLDMVVELTPTGDVVKIWNVLGDDPWARFSRDTDYRLVQHDQAAPRPPEPRLLHRRRAVGDALRAARRDLAERPDAAHRRSASSASTTAWSTSGRVYFTTVDGKSHRRHPDAGGRPGHGPDQGASIGHAPWLGAWPAHRRRTLWVGFSRIRPTKFRENVGWVLRGLKRDFGTHVGCYDLRTGNRVGQFKVEPFGLSAIFGIYSADAAGE